MRPRPFLVLGATLVMGSTMAGAQPPAAAPSSAGARITGVVRDSLAGGAPLAGARVQLVTADGDHALVRGADTDALGRYALERVPAGHYWLGFLHPMLDTLGVDPPLRAITVLGDSTIAADLATPSPTGIRVADCGPGAVGDASAVFTGVVRRAADGAPVAGAEVSAEWLEVAIRPGALGHRAARAADTTRSGGWFALCGVPRTGTVVLQARRGDERSDRVEATLARQELARRDLFVGADTAAGGRLRGVVVEAATGRPIAGAQVTLEGGPGARADSAGAWSLGALPWGTRSVLVKAVGFAPRRLAVDVVPEAADVRAALLASAMALDTIRVTASRARLEESGFEQRRRAGAGYYVTGEQLRQRRVFQTSDLFASVPGMRVERSRTGDPRITVRGLFGRCTPALFIDGLERFGTPLSDIDLWTDPQDIAGIEVYAGVVPAEFQSNAQGCGAVVVWTQPSTNPARRWSWKRRALHGATVLAIGVSLGLLLGLAAR